VFQTLSAAGCLWSQGHQPKLQPPVHSALQVTTLWTHLYRPMQHPVQPSSIKRHLLSTQAPLGNCKSEHKALQPTQCICMDMNCLKVHTSKQQMADRAIACSRHASTNTSMLTLRISRQESDKRVAEAKQSQAHTPLARHHQRVPTITHCDAIRRQVGSSNAVIAYPECEGCEPCCQQAR